MSQPVIIVTPGYAAPDDPVCLPGLRTLVSQLSKQRSVIVVALRYPAAGEYELDGAKIIALGGGDVAGVARCFWLAECCRAVESVARQTRPVAIHGFWADEPGWVATIVGHRTNTRSVVSLGGAELACLPARNFGLQLQVVGRALVHACLPNASAVTVGSPWLGEILGTRMPNIARKSTVAPLGVDVQQFATVGPRRPLGAGLHVAHVGSAVSVKAHDVLLSAWAQAQAALQIPTATKTTLHLVGAGTDHLTDFPQNVVAHGEIPHADLPELLRSLDLWVQSSSFESQSVALLEAAACGVAVLGTRVGLLADCKAALHRVPIDDPQALGHAMTNALLDAQALRHAGDHAREWSETFSADKTTAQFVQLYEDEPLLP